VRNRKCSYGLSAYSEASVISYSSIEEIMAVTGSACENEETKKLYIIINMKRKKKEENERKLMAKEI